MNKIKSISMIQIENLNFSYKKGLKLKKKSNSRSFSFKGLSLGIEKGTIVGLLGKNGEGKSSLLKLLSGQLIPQGGILTIDGFSPKERKVEFLRDIYLLPEEMFVPKLTIKEYFSIIVPFYPNYSQEIAEELMQEFELDWEMNLHDISQGQKKKALIALALSLRVSYLLMDEPTNALDIPSKSAFRRIVARYVTDEQTIIISTHQVRDLEQLIDRVIIMDHNQIICNCNVEDLSERLFFSPILEGKEDNLLYKEGGVLEEYGVYLKEPNFDEGEFSMELFFNAVISAKDKLLPLLKELMDENNKIEE